MMIYNQNTVGLKIHKLENIIHNIYYHFMKPKFNILKTDDKFIF